MENSGAEVLKGNREALSTKDQPNMKGRLMCFTSFNEEPPEFEPETMKYLGFGAEVCPTTGKKHWQGFVYWKRERWTYATRKKWKCKVFKCIGSLEDNEKYCQKEGNYKEYGQRPKQGERKDLEQLVGDILRRETSVETILTETPMIYHQYGRTLEKAEDIALREVYRTEMTTCDWYVGKTGRGKSHIAFVTNLYNPKTTYVYPNDSGWWDGYRGQETVIFNEFRGQVQYSEMLELIDKWPKTVRRRNREPYPFTSKHIIITSSLEPKEIYFNLNAKDSLEQLYSRINLIHVKGPNRRE